jgi:hypothetical protein
VSWILRNPDASSERPILAELPVTEGAAGG